MKIVKEILKHIILIGSLVSMATFITLVSFTAQDTLNSLIIIFSGLWVGVIVMINLCYILWPEELIKKLKKYN